MSQFTNQMAVYECIIDPTKARWSCPTGYDTEAWMQDCLHDLQGFPNEVLQAAFLDVRRAMPNRRYWPSPSEFRDACLKNRHFVGGQDNDNRLPFGGDPQRTAMQYRVEFMKDPKWNDAWVESWHEDVRKFVYEAALEQATAGETPNVEVTRGQVREWRQKAAERKGVGADNLGAEAKAKIDRWKRGEPVNVYQWAETER